MLHIERDLRSHFFPARDQGPRPTCLAFAISDAHAFMRKSGDPLSVDYLFYFAKLVNPPPDFHDGICLEDAIKALEANGQPPELVWPYSQVLPSDINLWIVSTAHPSALIASATHLTASTDEITQLIDNGIPPVIIMQLSPSFYVPDEDNVVVPVSNEAAFGLHALVAVAHGSYKNKKVILVRNSWGSTWGDQGYAWLYQDYVSSRLLSASTISI